MEVIVAKILEHAPNPQFAREHWTDLTGPWSFRYDDHNEGLANTWWAPWGDDDCLSINVPFPPESQLSGIADPSFHSIVWYQRSIPEVVEQSGEITLIHFGAVDYQAMVWIDDVPVGSHEGGSSPFTVAIETAWLLQLDSPMLTLRVFDDPTDLEQPRGKQAWTVDPADIWYKRTTGIWQPVWMEHAPATHINLARYVWQEEDTTLSFDVELNRKPTEPIQIRIGVYDPDGMEILTECDIHTNERLSSGSVSLKHLVESGKLAETLWHPGSPVLLPMEISTSTGDRIQSYVGLRSLELTKAGFSINDNPQWLRMVLSQGYFPQSHYAAPSPGAIRREVEITLALGFNGARTHQKAEDPRYLYWADRMGLLLWGEIGAAYQWSDLAVARLTNEWRELVQRDRNHPSIIAWVPFNESWGIRDVYKDSAQQNTVRSLYALTNSLDGTRPVIGNDGWEHVSTDILSLHDYVWSGEALTERYGSHRSNAEIDGDYSVANKHAIAALDKPIERYPLMITEYGGVSFAPHSEESWYGYGKVATDHEFADKYRELTSALHGSDRVTGICYTQLTDTEQETNGLLTEDRTPKIDIAILSEITRGSRH